MKTSSKLTIIPLMFCFFTMGFVDLVGIASNYVKEDLNLNDATANLFPSLVFFWFLIFSVPTGMLMNKIGRKKTVLLSLVVTVVSLLLPIVGESFGIMLASFSLLGIGNALGFINYTVIWRYFSWTNQTLAMIVLWAASMYLFKEKKNYWITAVPATFMSAVSCTYFVLAPECLGGLLNSKTAEGATIYNTAVAYPVGIIFAVAMLALFIHATKKHTEKKAA